MATDECLRGRLLPATLVSIALALIVPAAASAGTGGSGATRRARDGQVVELERVSAR